MKILSVFNVIVLSALVGCVFFFELVPFDVMIKFVGFLLIVFGALTVVCLAKASR